MKKSKNKNKTTMCWSLMKWKGTLTWSERAWECKTEIGIYSLYIYYMYYFSGNTKKITYSYLRSSTTSNSPPILPNSPLRSYSHWRAKQSHILPSSWMPMWHIFLANLSHTYVSPSAVKQSSFLVIQSFWLSRTLENSLTQYACHENQWIWST